MLRYAIFSIQRCKLLIWEQSSSFVVLHSPLKTLYPLLVLQLQRSGHLWKSASLLWWSSSPSTNAPPSPRWLLQGGLSVGHPAEQQTQWALWRVVGLCWAWGVQKGQPCKEISATGRDGGCGSIKVCFECYGCIPRWQNLMCWGMKLFRTKGNAGMPVLHRALLGSIMFSKWLKRKKWLL